MCGIFGMISKKSKRFNKRAFFTMGVRNDSRGGDSCGVFIDKQVEYGVDKQKMFISFFRDSILLKETNECKVALGHCRKASVGKVSLETAQPVVLTNSDNEVEFVLIHNGTIHNYEELAKKYIPEIDIKGLTDSQVMARIFYYVGYDCLDEYNGGAVFVIHDYRINKSLVFKGASKKTTYSKEQEEERPLYYCFHNGRFIFSSIFETLYAHYYEEDIYTLSPNRLMSVSGEKLKLVNEYSREKCTQNKPYVATASTLYDYDDFYGYSYKVNPVYKIKHDGIFYQDKDDKPLHGVFAITEYGYVHPGKKKTTEKYLHEVAFFMGKMLKSPEAFALINKKYQEANKNITREIQILINIMDFNPFTEDLDQFFWYDCDKGLVHPTGEWIYPMADLYYEFNSRGRYVKEGKKAYSNWTTDYYMYTYDENEILKLLERECAGQ